MSKEIQQLKNLRERKESKRDELRRIDNMISDLEIRVELPILKKKYEGNYYKFDNGYNGTERWWLYMHVLKVNSHFDIKVNSFETTTRGQEFKINHSTSDTILRIKITKKEYESEAKRFLKHANKLLNP